MKTAVVIGSGIGGLAASIRLINKGYEVIVLEKNNYPGGKLTEIKLGDYRFDAGPSLFTMPELVEELFEISNKNVNDYFTYSKLDKICNYFFEDGTEINATSNLNEFSKEIESKTNDSGDKVLKHLAKSRFIYNTTSTLFLNKSLHKIKSYLSFNTLISFLKLPFINPFSTMASENSKRFTDEKNQRLFNRYATYNGSNPYKAPAVLNIIPHLEFNKGAYFPKDGMISITQAIYKLALDLGVKFHFNSEVDKILTKKRKVVGVNTLNRSIEADIIVCNADVKTVYDNLLPSKIKLEKVLKQERSSSALIFYWGINGTFNQLDLHNILFSENYEAEFKSIFDCDYRCADPTVYINITSKYNNQDAPSNSENWFVMVNVPSVKSQNWDTLIKGARLSIINKINRVLKTDIEPLIVEEDILTPKLIESRTSSFAGSLYGTASNSRFSAFYRHSNFSKEYKGLFFCGGSVHPGGGIPLALSSAKIIDKYIKHV